MIRFLALLLLLTNGPPLIAGDQSDPTMSLGSVGVQTAPATQSIFIFSDYAGILYINGKKMGRVGAGSSSPKVISNLSPGNYKLELKNPYAVFVGEVSVEKGNDFYVYMRPAGAVVGRTMLELNYHPVRHTWRNVIIVGAAVLTVGIIVAIGQFLNSNPVFFGAGYS